MTIFGMGVLVQAILRYQAGEPPVAELMGWVGGLALAANFTCAALLLRHRNDGSASHALLARPPQHADDKADTTRKVATKSALGLTKYSANLIGRNCIRWRRANYPSTRLTSRLNNFNPLIS